MVEQGNELSRKLEANTNIGKQCPLDGIISIGDLSAWAVRYIIRCRNGSLAEVLCEGALLLPTKVSIYVGTHAVSMKARGRRLHMHPAWTSRSSRYNKISSSLVVMTTTMRSEP